MAKDSEGNHSFQDTSTTGVAPSAIFLAQPQVLLTIPDALADRQVRSIEMALMSVGAGVLALTLAVGEDLLALVQTWGTVPHRGGIGEISQRRLRLADGRRGEEESKHATNSFHDDFSEGVDVDGSRASRGRQGFASCPSPPTAQFTRRVQGRPR